MKIFKMNDSDWVAAENLESAIQCMADQFSEGEVTEMFKDEFIDNPHELTDEAMDTLKLTDEDAQQEACEDQPTDKTGDEWKERQEKYLATCPTFRQALQKMIDDGDEFPTHFASAE